MTLRFRLLDVDECQKEDHKCHDEAECVNVVGSYNCACKTGFEGDGFNCTRKWLLLRFTS